MNKNIIFSLFAMLLLLAGCDYNEEHFPGFDDVTRTDVVHFEGEFTGSYPSDGYFMNKAALADAVADMLEDLYPYCDKGSTAKVSVLFGEITEGFKAVTPDVSYTLTTEDYDAMGTESGQPGKYDNFDSNMDVAFYIATFMKNKFAYAEEGVTYEVSYKYYANKTTTTETILMKYDGTNWTEYDPYADVLTVSTKVAEMSYDGNTWSLGRLLGGSKTIVMGYDEYYALVEWVLTNKPAYKDTRYDNSEYYFGS